MKHDPNTCFCGSPMIQKGYGKYPYPCHAQDKHPQAMVYQGCTAGHTGWTVDLRDEQPTKIIEPPARHLDQR